MAWLASIAVLGLALAGPAAAEGRPGSGAVSFRHGPKAYRLPLETIDVEELRVAGRTEVHVSLVYRDARNRVFAIAFVHRGPGPLPAAAIDLTVSTPSGVSRYQRPGSTCELRITAVAAAAVEGKGRCRGLTDLGGERPAPDVSDVAFSGRVAATPPQPRAAPRARPRPAS